MTDPKQVKGGRYTLLRTLGEGSQGETYEARDEWLRSAPPSSEPLDAKWEAYVRRARAGETRNARGLVAIKCFRVGKAKAWKDVELAEREARTLASLEHPRLPRYIDHFEEDGGLYLVMEKIEGESLASIRARGRTLSVAEVTTMIEQIGEALRYLHGRAPTIVHRDVKPANVLRRPDGSFALVDFGSVRDRLKPAGGSTVVGTFGYMAPEQFQGRASPRSDVYGLAATALSMLTGTEPEELPHEGLGIAVSRALAPGTPAHLARALTAMLVPDPDRRSASIEEALAVLHGTTERVSAVPPSHAMVGRDRGERRRERRRARRADREERRRRRALARARRMPFVPRLGAQLGILIARLAVWLAVGVLAPIVLTLLSLVFGAALRRAAMACVAAARRSEAAMSRASAWVGGHRSEDTEATADDPSHAVLIAEDPRVRIAGDEEPAEEADEELDALGSRRRIR